METLNLYKGVNSPYGYSMLKGHYTTVAVKIVAPPTLPPLIVSPSKSGTRNNRSVVVGLPLQTV